MSYREIDIQPASGGFGQYDARITEPGDIVYDSLEEVAHMMREICSPRHYRLGDADCPPEIEDIRGRIRNESYLVEVWGYQGERDEVYYVGIEKCENEEEGEA